MTNPSTPKNNDETIIKIITIVTLGVIIIVSIIGVTAVAIFTERDPFKVEVLIAFGAIMLATVGGTSLVTLRRKKHWSFRLDRDEEV